MDSRSTPRPSSSRKTESGPHRHHDHAEQAATLLRAQSLKVTESRLLVLTALLDRHRVWMVHAPWAEIRCPGEPPLLSFQPQEFHEQCQRMDELGVACERIRHRGLATITPLVLAECCVDPATRRAHGR